MSEQFWKTKTLAEMSHEEWESLCDGCGRCCLNKLEDEDTGDIYWTNIACRLLDCTSCRCRDYSNRFEQVADCVAVDLAGIERPGWLPPTCAYRLIHEGKDLYPWHPLVSGDPASVHEAGISVRGRTVPEDGLEVSDFEDYLVDWPGEE